MKTINLFFVGALGVFGATVAGCGGNDCGDGTVERDGTCVVNATQIQCGAGTRLVDGECVTNEGLVCGDDTVLNEDGSACVVAATACSAPATFDTATGRCVSPSEITCGNGTELDGDRCIPACNGSFEVKNPQRTGCLPAAGVQVVHASPDPSLATVDLYSGDTFLQDDDTVIGDDFAFGTATPFISVAEEFGLQVSAADSTDNSSPLLETAPGELEAGTVYFLVIRGVVNPSDFDTGANAAIGAELVVIEDPNIVVDPGQSTQLALFHAVPDVGSVSAGRQTVYGQASGAELFTNVSYTDTSVLRYTGEDGGPPTLATGTQAFDVYASGGGLPVASLQTSSGEAIPAASGLEQNTVGVLVAMGFLDPSANQDGPGLQVVAVLPDGTAGVLDAAARLQVVNTNSRSYDVYFAEMGATALGDVVESNLGSLSATAMQSFVAGPGRMFQLTQPGDPAFDLNTAFSPEFGSVSRLVIHPRPGMMDQLSVVTGTEQASDGSFDIELFHAAPNVDSPVDVHFSPNPGEVDPQNPAVDALAFDTDVEPAAPGVFRDYFVNVASDGGSTSIVNFNADFTNLFNLSVDGSSLFAALSGNDDSAPDLDLLIVAPSGEFEAIPGAIP
ncbi:MAG: hypothetical protein AAFQ65_01435 [Myxococcota bacterium]